MLTIDWEGTFSDGVNLVNEYINAGGKYGHWKGIGFRLSGVPIQNLTRMFSHSWNGSVKFYPFFIAKF